MHQNIVFFVLGAVLFDAFCKQLLSTMSIRLGRIVELFIWFCIDFQRKTNKSKTFVKLVKLIVLFRIVLNVCENLST